MTNIINPNQPQQNELEKFLNTMAQQVHQLTLAVVQLQEQMKELKGEGDKEKKDD